jgi:branched-chain amino acid aminotransferase
MGEPTVYLNGEFIPESQAHISIIDQGFTMGVHAMELTRTFNKKLFRIDLHLDRLYRTLKSIRIDPRMDRQEMARLSDELVERNAKPIGDSDELALIHFVTPGLTPSYVDTPKDQIPPTVGMHTYPLNESALADKFENGIHVVCVKIRHQPPECMDPKLKVRSRLYWYLADCEAQMVDPSAIPLVLDIQGNIAECHGSNFLIVQDGVILSPTTRNMLEGVTWRITLELAEKLGIPVVTRDLTMHEAYNADEAMVTSSGMCTVPVTKVDGIQIGDGKPGPVVKRLLGAWSELAGYDVVEHAFAARRSEGR